MGEETAFARELDAAFSELQEHPDFAYVRNKAHDLYQIVGEESFPALLRAIRSSGEVVAEAVASSAHSTRQYRLDI